MSDFDWDYEDNEDETPQGPKALRELYKKQRDEKAELEKQLAALSARVREQELSKAFSSAGIPEKVAGLFPRDLDPTEENITKFVADYGDLFSPQKPPEPVKTEPETTAQNISAGVQDQFNQMSQVTQTGTPSTMTAKERLESMLNNPRLYDEVPHDEFLKALREVA